MVSRILTVSCIIFLYCTFKGFNFLLISDPLFANSLLKHAREANAKQTIQFEIGGNTDTSMDSKRTEKRSHEETEITDKAVNNITDLASPRGE